MLKRSFARLHTTARRFHSRASRVQYIDGSASVVPSSNDVQLRGIRIQGNYKDLPSLLFFPDLFDQAENWVPYFTSPNSQILDYRNVFILYPRNFGSSDWCNDFADDHCENTANDIERFMYQHKITMATVGGHGFGAKNALMAGCFKHDLVTGILAYDYSPQDYCYSRVGNNFRGLLTKLNALSGKQFEKAEFDQLLAQVASPKMRAILGQNLRQVGARTFELKFNLPAVTHLAEEFINWKKIQYGLYPGRVNFVFPEYSNFVFLGTNTLPMMRVCPKAQGYFHDIQMVLTESDNPELNHWIYEDPLLSSDFQAQTLRFLQNYDGVDVRLMNRSELREGLTIPEDRPGVRHDRYSGHIQPPHFHHNWRFQDRPELK